MNQIEFNKYYTNILIAATLTSTLTGIMVTNMVSSCTKESTNISIEQLKICNPYEHIFYIKYPKKELKDQLIIPEGYKVLRITPSKEEYKVWYTNYERVMAKEKENKAGFVIDQEKSSNQKIIESKTI